MRNADVIRAYLGTGYAHAETAGDAPVLALSGVTAGYGSVPAVRDLSIAVGEGEAVGLLGANGAGKSTTLARDLGSRARVDGNDHLSGKKHQRAAAVRNR